jgi:DNA-binding response OmpR family regulator
MRTLLFVEDDKLISKKVKLTIEAEISSEVRILCAYTVQETLEIVKVTHIDIFIIDVKLPDGNGISLAKELRKTHEFTPMMIASSVNDLRTQVEANNELDIFLYLTKPYVPNELIPDIKSILKRLRTPIENCIVMKKGSKTFKIDLNQVIMVVKVTGEKQIEIHMYDEKQEQMSIQTFPMQSLEKFNTLLNDPRDLIRINQSSFINPKFVEYYDGIENEVHLKNTSRLITIGKNFKDNVKLLFK